MRKDFEVYVAGGESPFHGEQDYEHEAIRLVVLQEGARLQHAQEEAHEAGRAYD